MERKEPRKRIPYEKKDSQQPVEDLQAFVENKCSLRARKIRTINPHLGVNLWFDQHYQLRTQFGDDQGARIGIDAERVESLVNRSMLHLFTHGAILKSFSFINEGLGTRNERVVLQEETLDGLLNVVVEIHLLEVGVFEVTVKTAMCSENFSMSDGQYALQLTGSESILKRMERGILKDIHNI